MMKALLKPMFISALVLALAACGSRVELLKDISEAEANVALAALLQAGISAGKLPGKEGMVSLDVAQSEVAQAITILNAEGLPHERYAKMGDVFRKEGLISSPLEERARYLWALSQELSATVSQIDGVIKARVHVVLPEKSSGGDPALPSSAAVFIKYKPGYNLDDAVPQVKRLVSNSIPGLSADKVTVVMLAASGKPVAPTTASTTSATPLKATNSALTLMTFGDDGRDGVQPWLIWALCGLLLVLLMGLAFLIWRRWGSAIGFGKKAVANQTTKAGA